MIFFTSDQHYYHNNIISYSNRPFSSVSEMNETMIENHNKIVNKGDNVYFLGDFCFGNNAKIQEVLEKLNGQKHLILGNHDKEISNKPKNYLGGKLLTSIQHYKEISYNEQKICLFHYGARVWNKSHRLSWLLFGHSHGSLPPHNRSVDVGVDSTWITGKAEYRPFSFDEIKSFMETRPYEKLDHHDQNL